MLDAINIQGKNITTDALLTQRKVATYLVEERHAYYHFTVKNNQPGLFQDIALYFDDREEPDFIICDPPDHGRIEIRKIWITTELNGYLKFPYVRQAFVIERESTNKKTGNVSHDIAYGITSQPPEQASPKKSLKLIVVTGVSRTVAITSSIGILTRTEAVFVPAMAPKTYPAYAVLL